MNWDSCLDKTVDPTGVATLKCLPIVYQNLINTALIFAGAFTVGFIILAGFKLMNSGGSPDKVKSAKGTLTWAIVGLIVVLLSFFIVNFISFFTGVDCIKQVGFDNCATP